MKKTIITTIILSFVVFSLYAQNIVVIGEVEDIKDGIVFNLQETTGITWHSLCDGGGHYGGIAESFNITSLPCYILLAPDGTYKARLKSSEVYSDEFNKYINGE